MLPIWPALAMLPTHVPSQPQACQLCSLSPSNRRENSWAASRLTAHFHWVAQWTERSDRRWHQDSPLPAIPPVKDFILLGLIRGCCRAGRSQDRR